MAPSTGSLLLKPEEYTGPDDIYLQGDGEEGGAPFLSLFSLNFVILKLIKEMP